MKTKFTEKELETLYKRKAARATFTNSFIRDCLSGSLDYKELNGDTISLREIEKVVPEYVAEFRAALSERREFMEGFTFRGSDCLMWIEISDGRNSYFPKDYAGDVNAVLALCRYGKVYNSELDYILINEKTFIYCGCEVSQNKKVLKNGKWVYPDIDYRK